MVTGAARRARGCTDGAAPHAAPLLDRRSSEASLGPPSGHAVMGSRSGRSAIRARSGRDPRSVRPTAAVRCAKVRSASRPAGHSESGWSDKVSADVERTRVTLTPGRDFGKVTNSQPPRSATPLPRHCSEPVAPDGAVPGYGDISDRKHPALAAHTWRDALWSWFGTRCLRPPLRATG